MSSPLIYIPGQARRPVAREAPGRRVGTTAGSHVAGELSELHSTIWLCWACKPKFDHKRHHYFYEKNLRVSGRCDGCKEYRENSHLFVHESTVVQNGRSKHGDSWLPR